MEKDYTKTNENQKCKIEKIEEKYLNNIEIVFFYYYIIMKYLSGHLTQKTFWWEKKNIEEISKKWIKNLKKEIDKYNIEKINKIEDQAIISMIEKTKGFDENNTKHISRCKNNNRKKFYWIV